MTRAKPVDGLQVRTYDALCVDPGGTTGYARVDLRQRLVVAGQLVGNEWEQVDALLRMWLDGREAHVPAPPAIRRHPAFVCEAFNLRSDLHRGAASKADTLSPVRISAMLEYTAYRMGVKGVVPLRWASTGAISRPTSSDAMTFATDERLRRWGLYVPGDHARDAVRHACLWIVRGAGGDPTDGWRAVRERL